MNNIRCDTEKRTVSICIKRPDKMIVAQFEFESAEKMNQFLDILKVRYKELAYGNYTLFDMVIDKPIHRESVPPELFLN